MTKTEIEMKPGFNWFPGASCRYALNFLFKDEFRSRLFERHFFKYWQSKFTVNRKVLSGTSFLPLSNEILQSIRFDEKFEKVLISSP